MEPWKGGEDERPMPEGGSTTPEGELDQPNLSETRGGKGWTGPEGPEAKPTDDPGTIEVIGKPVE